MYSSVNTIWVLFWHSSGLLYAGHGFSLCEAGFTRAKNTGNILMKNLMDFCIGTPGILAGRIRTDVWKRFRNHWQL